ncbi:MAG: hypothetical protein ACR2F1_05615 [Nitrososphaeraceae archaeon]
MIYIKCSNCPFKLEVEEDVSSFFSFLGQVKDRLVHFLSCISTAFAEKDNDDKELSKYDVDVLCDATEDYEQNKEQCDKLYDIVEDDEEED